MLIKSFFFFFSFERSQREEWCFTIFNHFGCTEKSKKETTQAIKFHARIQRRRYFAYKPQSFSFTVILTNRSQRSKYIGLFNLFSLPEVVFSMFIFLWSSGLFLYINFHIFRVMLLTNIFFSAFVWCKWSSITK